MNKYRTIIQHLQLKGCGKMAVCRQSGAIIIEFAVFIGLMVIFLSGVTNLGFRTQEILAGEKAVHTAARSASSLASSFPSMSGEVDLTQVCTTENSVSGTTALESAIIFACNNLSDTTIDVTDWTVTASISTGICEDGTCPNYVCISATNTSVDRYFALFGVDSLDGISACFAIL